jgi:hypothetical protein
MRLDGHSINMLVLCMVDAIDLKTLAAGRRENSPMPIFKQDHDPII